MVKEGKDNTPPPPRFRAALPVGGADGGVRGAIHELLAPRLPRAPSPGAPPPLAALPGRMSVSYFVRYDVAVADLKDFLERYRKVHVPAVTSWPGLQRMVIHTPVDWKDPFPVNRGKAVLMAQLEFDSEEAMNRAFASPERDRKSTRLNSSHQIIS